MESIIVCVVTQHGILDYMDFETYEDALFYCFDKVKDGARCWRMYDATWFDGIPHELDFANLVEIAESPTWHIERGIPED